MESDDDELDEDFDEWAFLGFLRTVCTRVSCFGKSEKTLNVKPSFSM